MNFGNVTVAEDERRYIRLGWWALFVGFSGFLLWAAFAPLDKGVAASGTVIVSGHRKVVQSPVTGVVKKIEVREGSHVKAGELLIQLSQVQALAQLSTLEEKYLLLGATLARLDAEENNLSEMHLPASFKDNPDPRLKSAIALQQQLLLSRRQAFEGEIDGYRYANEGFNVEAEGVEKSLVSKRRQLELLSEQKTSLAPLAADGYLPRNRFREIQNQHASIASDVDEMTGRLHQLKQKRQEISARIVQRQAEYRREVASLIAETRASLTDVTSQLQIAERDRQYMRIIAPTDGSIVGLTVFTEGAVVQPGEKLMEIVPEQANLMVEARLDVNLVDKVWVGLPVDILFTAFNQNTTPRLSGEVTMISADRLTDASTGNAYYPLQIAISPDAIKQLKNKSPKAGMAVEIFIKTGERTLLNYLFKPLGDRLRLSMTEE